MVNIKGYAKLFLYGTGSKEDGEHLSSVEAGHTDLIEESAGLGAHFFNNIYTMIRNKYAQVHEDGGLFLSIPRQLVVI